MRIVLVLVAWVQECCVAKEQRGTRMNVAQAQEYALSVQVQGNTAYGCTCWRTVLF